MNLRFKYISIVLVLILMSISPLACGGGGTKVPVTPATGGIAEFEGLTLDVSPGTVSEETEIKLSVLKDPPELVEGLDKEEAEMISSVYRFIGDVYDVEIGEELNKPVKVTLGYSPGDIPADFSEEDLFIVHYVDGKWQIVASTVDPSTHTVYAHVTHFSALGLILVAGGLLLLTAGALYFSLLTKPAFIGTAYKYLTPDAENIKRAVASGNFVVDKANNRLLLKGVPLKLKIRSSLSRPKTGEEMMRNAEGMCEDYSNLFGSLLIAAGYPVRAVGGEATYIIGGKEISGGHAWIEVLINGSVYYVDTFNADKTVVLRPISEARTSLKLKSGKMWGKTKDGKAIKSRDYDPLWPLLGEWQLTRTGITPELPVPNLVINRVIDEKPKWELSRGADDKLAIDYSGRKQWYKTLGQNIVPEIIIRTEDENGTWCTLDSGGKLYMEDLPGLFNFLLSMGSKENKKIEKITVVFEDEVKLALTNKNNVLVTITADAKGKYLATRERINPETGETEDFQIWKNFEYNGIRVTYEAKRKD